MLVLYVDLSPYQFFCVDAFSPRGVAGKYKRCPVGAGQDAREGRAGRAGPGPHGFFPKLKQHYTSPEGLLTGGGVVYPLLQK